MKLYVGNLPYNTSEDDLRSLFSTYGAVSSVAIITDRDTGRSKGFGFVEFGSDGPRIRVELDHTAQGRPRPIQRHPRSAGLKR